MTRKELEKLAEEYCKLNETKGYISDQYKFEEAFITGFLAGRDAAADIAGKSWAMYDEDSIESEVAYDIQDSINKLGKEND